MLAFAIGNSYLESRLNSFLARYIEVNRLIFTTKRRSVRRKIFGLANSGFDGLRKPEWYESKNSVEVKKAVKFCDVA